MSFVTGSRRWDLVVCGVLAGLMLIGSARLRVYHSVTIVELDVVRVASDGTRQGLPLPPELAEPEQDVDALQQRIRSYMSEASGWGSSNSGSRLEWTLRYARDSTKLTNERRMVFDADGTEQP